MDNDKVKIIGTGKLSHYKNGVPYEISQARLRTIPKNSYTLVKSDAPLFDEPKAVTKPAAKTLPEPKAD
jgi:hypothetical protein